MHWALNTEPCVNVKIGEFKQEAFMFLDSELDTKDSEIREIDNKYGSQRGCGCAIGLFLPFFLLPLFRNESGLNGIFFTFVAFVIAVLSIAFAIRVTAQKEIEKDRLEAQIKEIKQAIEDLQK